MNDSRGSGVGAAYRSLAESDAKDARAKAGVCESPVPDRVASMLLLACTRTQAQAALNNQYLPRNVFGRMLHYGENWATEVESNSLMYTYDLLVDLSDEGRIHVTPNFPSSYLLMDDDDEGRARELRDMIICSASVIIIPVPFPLVMESSPDGERVRDEVKRFLVQAAEVARGRFTVKLVRCTLPSDITWSLKPKKFAQSEQKEEDVKRTDWSCAMFKDWEVLSSKPFKESRSGEQPPCTCSSKGDEKTRAAYLTWSSLTLDWSDPKSFAPALGAALIEGFGAAEAPLRSGPLRSRCRCLIQ